MRRSGLQYIALLTFMVAALYALPAEDVLFTLLRSKVEADFSLVSSMPGTIVVNVASTGQNIGDLTFSSNIPGTWRVSVASQNGGALIRDGGRERFPYRFNFGGEIRNFDLSSNMVVEYFGPKAPTTVSLSLDFTSAFDLGIPTGTYRDTITITLSAL